MAANKNENLKKGVAYLVSLLGAIGVALQNTIAVELFIKSLINGGRFLQVFSRAAAIGLGGACSGMVNFFINVELLEGFLERFTSDKPKKVLEGWRKFRYYAGTAVFVLTGILFGAMAFTFGMASPLALLAVASGVFVTIIMTIQEVETWLQSFDDPKFDHKASLKDIFNEWKSTLTWKKAFGHIIAAGNVLALSLLFTLGFAELLIALHVAAFPALVVALTISFTFGAFTEFYFYNFFLAKFCEKIEEKWQAMNTTKFSVFGHCCTMANALVNGALTYSGIGLLTGLLTAAGVVLPPVGLIVAISAVSAIFAASASYLLGMDFWIRKMSPEQSAEAKAALSKVAVVTATADETQVKAPFIKPGLAFYPTKQVSAQDQSFDAAPAPVAVYGLAQT